MSLLLSLSAEILDLILSDLANCDIKNLRLTSTNFAKAVRLRLNRIFLSPHPRDIEVFRAVAKHNFYRELVTELIYDDACFPSSVETEEDIWIPNGDHPPPLRIPAWYEREYQQLVEEHQIYSDGCVQKLHHVAIAKQLAARLSLKQSYKYYQGIVQAQNRMIAQESDERALVYGITQFPKLRRITITPTAHGISFRPRYETPMIRSLPYGFIYPIPRGWPTPGQADNYPVAEPWESEDEKNKWRGVCLVLRVLANHAHRITEFIFDVNQLLTGLSCRIFDQRNPDYDNLVSLLSTPNFSRLDLALYLGDEDHNGWGSLNSGLLSNALAKAKSLKYFSLATSIRYNLYANRTHFGASAAEHSISLGSILPLDQWKELRHFGLSRFKVTQEDIVNFLSKLPRTVFSIDLAFLWFLEPNGGNYRDLLHDIRNKLKWHELPAFRQPKITLYLDFLEGQVPGWSIDISQEANNFLYYGGPNPFQKDIENFILQDQNIGIERYAFDPVNDRPWADYETLVDAGIFKRDTRVIPGFQ